MRQEHEMRILFVAALVWISIASGANANDQPEEAARKLLRLMDAESTAVGGADAMAGVMVQQNPMLQPFRSVLLEWAEKVFKWENFEGRFVAMYVDSFTEAEIRDMIAFYETPTGQKLVRIQPELMQKGAMLGAELASEHSGELDAMIRARSVELEQLGDQTDG
jgi:hypothetical protein